MDFSAGISFFFGQLGKLFFSFGSSFSLSSLVAPLIIAAGHLKPLLTRRRGGPAPMPAGDCEPA